MPAPSARAASVTRRERRRKFLPVDRRSSSHPTRPPRRVVECRPWRCPWSRSCGSTTRPSTRSPSRCSRRSSGRSARSATSTRALVLRGRGERAFSAGADVTDFAAGDPGLAAAIQRTASRDRGRAGAGARGDPGLLPRRRARAGARLRPALLHRGLEVRLPRDPPRPDPGRRRHAARPAPDRPGPREVDADVRRPGAGAQGAALGPRRVRRRHARRGHRAVRRRPRVAEPVRDARAAPAPARHARRAELRARARGVHALPPVRATAARAWPRSWRSASRAGRAADRRATSCGCCEVGTKLLQR